VRESEELLSEARKCPADLLVVEPWDLAGRSTSAVIGTVRAEFLQPPPIAVYCDLRKESVKELVNVIRAGASEVILRDIDDDRFSLGRLLASSRLSSGFSEAAASADTIVPLELRLAVRHALYNASSGLTAERLAAEVGLRRRTLSKRARRRGLVGVRMLISSARVLLAIGMSARDRWCAEEIAANLGFSSAAGLRNMLKRHTGLSLPAAVRRGGLEYWCQRLFAPLARRSLSRQHIGDEL
jgi:AraC-like DNA-binding protein